MIEHKMVEKIVKNIWRNCGTRSTESDLLKEKHYKIAMILLYPVQGPWASSYLNLSYFYEFAIRVISLTQKLRENNFERRNLCDVIIRL